MASGCQGTLAACATRARPGECARAPATVPALPAEAGTRATPARARGLDSSAREAAARTALQIGFLHQALVLMTHQVCLNLRGEVHHHNYHDQQRGAAEIERNRPRRPEELRNQADQGEVKRTPR